MIDGATNIKRSCWRCPASEDSDSGVHCREISSTVSTVLRGHEVCAGDYLNTYGSECGDSGAAVAVARMASGGVQPIPSEKSPPQM